MSITTNTTRLLIENMIWFFILLPVIIGLINLFFKPNRDSTSDDKIEEDCKYDYDEERKIITKQKITNNRKNDYDMEGMF